MSGHLLDVLHEMVPAYVDISLAVLLHIPDIYQRYLEVPDCMDLGQEVVVDEVGLVDCSVKTFRWMMLNIIHTESNLTLVPSTY